MKLYLPFLLSIVLSLPAEATTVAFDGVNLAADSQITISTKLKNNKWKVVETHYKYQKIHYVNGYLVGVAGCSEDFYKFLNWLGHQAEVEYPEKGEFKCIVICQAGCYIYEGSRKLPKKVSPPIAIGSGEDIAMLEMEKGASAIEAVRIAEKKDKYSGGPILSVKVK